MTSRSTESSKAPYLSSTERCHAVTRGPACHKTTVSFDDGASEIDAAASDAASSVGASTLRNQTPCLGVTNAPLAMRSASATVAFFHRRFANWKWQRKYSSPAGPKRRPPSKRQ